MFSFRTVRSSRIVRFSPNVFTRTSQGGIQDIPAESMISYRSPFHRRLTLNRDRLSSRHRGAQGCCCLAAQRHERSVLVFNIVLLGSTAGTQTAGFSTRAQSLVSPISTFVNLLAAGDPLDIP